MRTGRPSACMFFTLVFECVCVCVCVCACACFACVCVHARALPSDESSFRPKLRAVIRLQYWYGHRHASSHHLTHLGSSPKPPPLLPGIVSGLQMKVSLFLSRPERSQSKTPRYTSQDRGPSAGPPPGLVSRPIWPRQRVGTCPGQALSCGSDDARLSAPFCPAFARILPSIVRHRGRGRVRRGTRPGPGESCYESLLRWHGD